MKSIPDVTLAELANATGLSVAGVKKNIRKLKDANLIRRVQFVQGALTVGKPTPTQPPR